MKTKLRSFSTLEAASLSAADLLQAAAERALAEKGFFTLVLTGGAEVRPLYRFLADPPYSSRLAWQGFHFFWGDERCLPPEHEQSNYGQAKKLFLGRVIAPLENVHRMPGELDPESGAREYELELRAFFAPHPDLTDGHFPRFDFLLLGMGVDGHTASLFPGSPLLQEAERWVAAVPEPAGEPPVPRLTLTLPVLNRARSVLFLTAGRQKQEIVEQILAAPQAAAARFPAARVQTAGEQWWFHAAGEAR